MLWMSALRSLEAVENTGISSSQTYQLCYLWKGERDEASRSKQKLSELENRIATREKEMEEDRVLIRYLQGYVAGVDSLLNQN